MKKLSKGMVLDGAFASEAVDTSGEILDVAGCDISTLEDGLGVVNYEHQGSTPEDVLGKVLTAKKIFGPEDCTDDRQLAYWNKIGLPFIYGKAELFDSEGHPGARAAAAIVRYYHSRGEPLLARWSIEGTTMEREGGNLKRSVAKNVALTLKPCNRSCSSGLVEEANIVSDQPGVAKSEGKTSFLRKGEFAECSGVVDDPYSGTLEASFGAAIDGLKELTALAKTITAATNACAAPGALVGGSALQAEHVERKNHVLSALRDWDRVVPIKKFLKNRMPEASDDYVDLFSGLVNDFEMKKAEELFADLHGALSKGTGAGQLVTESVPTKKRRKLISVGGHKIEGAIADQRHGDRIRQELTEKGHSDLVLYRGIGRPGGRKSGVKVLPTAMSSDVRYYTLSRPQAEAVAHWKSGSVTGETRKYGARVKNPLIVESVGDESGLWNDVGEHIAAKHGYKHHPAYTSAVGGTILAQEGKISPEHQQKDLRGPGQGVDWGVYGPGEKGTRQTVVKQFLGEYLRDKGHDAAVFLSRRHPAGFLQVPSDGMSQVVIPHTKDVDEFGIEMVKGEKDPELAAQTRERGKPRRFELDGFHGAEGSRGPLEDGDYVLWQRHPDDGRERPVFRFLSEAGNIRHLEDHTGGSLSLHVPEGPMTQESHAALESILSDDSHVLEKMEEDGEAPESEGQTEDSGDDEVAYEYDDGGTKRYYRLNDDRLMDEDGEPLTDDETEELLYSVECGEATMKQVGADAEDQGGEPAGSGEQGAEQSDDE